MSAHGAGFTQRLALACARRPWLTIAAWTLALAAAGAAYLAWGNVFTSSVKFLSHPDSEKAAALIRDHGGPGGGSLARAGASVQQLADGIGSAQLGAQKLARGSRTLSSGAQELERGLRELARGAGQVSSSTGAASAGADSLSRGLAGAAQGAASLSSGIEQAGVAAGGFAAGLLDLSRGGARLSAAAADVAGGADDLASGAAATADGVEGATAAAGRLEAGAGSLDALVAAYLGAHPEATGDATYQQIIGLSAQLSAGASELASGLASASAGASAVASGAADLASGASSLAFGARALDAGLAETAGGARAFDRSMSSLAAGGEELAGGVSSAAAGSRELAAGSRQLAAGSAQVSTGASKAAAGAGEVASATGGVASGASRLSKGLARTASGAGELSDALTSVGTLTDRVSEVVVVRSRELRVDDPAFRRQVVGMRDRIAALPTADVAGVLSVYDKGLDERTRGALTSDDRHATILKVEMATSVDDAVNHLEGLHRIVGQVDAEPRFEAAVTGAASLSRDAQHLAGEDLRRGEVLGVPVALVILVIVFGAFVAAGLPLLLSVFSIVVALALTVLVGHAFELSVFALNILTAVGLALGIDYSLFIVSRYREERRGGLDKMAAIGAASATASNAVFFSGMTVVFSLVGMLIVPLSIFTSLGVGAMAAALTAVAAALTLLPALLALLGDKVDALPVPWLYRYERRHTEHGWWGRAARWTMRRPALNLAIGGVLLLALAAPALTMKSGGFSADSFPPHYTSKRGLDMLQRDFAAGMGEPVSVVVAGDVGDTGVQKAIKRMITTLTDDGRFTPTGVATSADGTLAVIQSVQEAEAMSGEAQTAVTALRDELVPGVFAGAPAEVYVGGSTAIQIDSVGITTGYMPLVIGVVLLLSFVLLLLAFRSMAVALTAILMNLLSVGAAYGVLTLVFQRGWGAALLGLTRVEAIESWVPLLMFCVLFGLSMDYQVFLLSRIRERWTERRDSGDAVVFGLQSTAGIITGAALIMVAVFAGMGSGDLVVLQELGFGLAVAVVLDAFLVRVIVAPALIALIGDRYWWMPRWLEWLPHIDIEGRAAETAGGAGGGEPAAAPAGGPTPASPGARPEDVS